MSTYAPLDVTFSHGEGAWLWDTQGNQYLDALCGIAVTGLGHAHPRISQALCDQAGKLMHVSNLFAIEQQKQLAEKLCQLSGMDRVFFSNSGAEANEAAIKLARLYGHNKGIKQPTIVVTENSFHGRTLATLTATGNRKVQAGFEPLVAGFLRAPYNDVDALSAIAKNNKDVVAVMVEPVQGESGIRVPRTDYLNRLRQLCDDNGWLLILDEIQTGVARSGQWFSHQHNKIVPDIMTLAKALGNGMPIGACLATGKAAETFQPGNHGSTYGGNPLACRTALEVLRVIEDEDLVTRAATLGQNLLTGLQTQLGAHPKVADIRGQGLLLAVELNIPCKGLAQAALEQGLVINVTAENTIRLLPPLIMSDEQAQQLIANLVELINNFDAS